MGGSDHPDSSQAVPTLRTLRGEGNFELPSAVAFATSQFVAPLTLMPHLSSTPFGPASHLVKHGLVGVYCWVDRFPDPSDNFVRPGWAETFCRLDSNFTQ